jgi:hypothetical protein
MLTQLADPFSASCRSIPVLATGGSGTSENDRTKGKAKEWESSEAAHHLKLEKGIREEKGTI